MSEEDLQNTITQMYSKFSKELDNLHKKRYEVSDFKKEDDLLRKAFDKRNVSELEGHVEKANEALDQFKKENYSDYNRSVFATNINQKVAQYDRVSQDAP